MGREIGRERGEERRGEERRGEERRIVKRARMGMSTVLN
jgi:hypothetical protein